MSTFGVNVATFYNWKVKYEGITVEIRLHNKCEKEGKFIEGDSSFNNIFSPNLSVGRIKTTGFHPGGHYLSPKVYLNDRIIELFYKIKFQINSSSFYWYNLLVYF